MRVSISNLRESRFPRDYLELRRARALHVIGIYYTLEERPASSSEQEVPLLPDHCRFRSSSHHRILGLSQGVPKREGLSHTVPNVIKDVERVSRVSHSFIVSCKFSLLLSSAFSRSELRLAYYLRRVTSLSLFFQVTRKFNKDLFFDRARLTLHGSRQNR